LEVPSPDSYGEVLATGLLVVGFGLAALSLRAKDVVRLAGVFIVAGIAVAADDGFTYFASVFIVATVITELDFLEKLAAIIRGNDAYFRYRTESLSLEETKRRAAEELPTGEPSSETSEQEPAETSQTPVATPQRGADWRYLAEQLALSYLERRLGPIQRNVRLTRGEATMVLDGLVQRERGPDTLIEVKVPSRKLTSSVSIQFGARVAADRVSLYTQITGRKNAQLLLVFVVLDKTANPDAHRVAAELSAKESQMSIEIIDIDDIGLPRYSIPAFGVDE
jgi:hypothetical protein